ncbi:MAG: hypothetical protein WCK13_06680 [Ignavibacteriota bacterium]
MKQSKDVKFIIYQVLYIFIIVVLTLKGADIDLTKMIKPDGMISITAADSLKVKIDSLLALGVKPEDILRDRHDNIASTDPLIIYKGGFGSFDANDNTGKDNIYDNTVKVATDVNKPADFQFEIQKPVQFRVNQVSVNRNSEPLYIYGDGKLLTTVQPNQGGSFILKGESTVVYKCGNAEKQTGTKENVTQTLNFQAFNAGGSEKSLREIQSTVGWRVVVSDDYYDQIDVKITGPVKWEDKGKGTFDVKLMLCGSKDEFERKFGDKDGPYRANFTVTATDKISGKKISQMKEFVFGEW